MLSWLMICSSCFGGDVISPIYWLQVALILMNEHDHRLPRHLDETILDRYQRQMKDTEEDRVYE